VRRVVLAFLTLYLVWGSTYLAIRIGVQPLPPLLFAGARWLVAGAALLVYARLRGEAWPRTGREWRIMAIVGPLLIVGGNGLVVFGERWVESGLAALIVATTALWIAGLGSVGRQGEAVGAQAGLGLSIGFGGVVLLMWPTTATPQIHLLGELLIALAAFLWALGTIYARRARPRTPVVMATAIQSLIGGGILALMGAVAGEAGAWQWQFAGLAALAYLTVFGSLGFFAYLWLMHHTTPAKLGTYAYVNPAIAVLLGGVLLDERLSGRQWLGTAIILAGVALVTTAKTRPQPQVDESPA